MILCSLTLKWMYVASCVAIAIAIGVTIKSKEISNQLEMYSNLTITV